MSRALFALLTGRFAEAWFWHPMVYSLPLLALLIWQDGRIFKKRCFNIIVYVFFIGGFTLCYAARLLGILTPV